MLFAARASVSSHSHSAPQGDAKALATAKKEYIDTQKNLEIVAGNLFKFQLYLSALEGTAPPDPPVGMPDSPGPTENDVPFCFLCAPPHPPPSIARSAGDEHGEDDFEDVCAFKCTVTAAHRLLRSTKTRRRMTMTMGMTPRWHMSLVLLP